jgi:hypothetical protein
MLSLAFTSSRGDYGIATIADGRKTRNCRRWARIGLFLVRRSQVKVIRLRSPAEIVDPTSGPRECWANLRTGTLFVFVGELPLPSVPSPFLSGRARQL